MSLNFKTFLKKIDNYLLPSRCLICHQVNSLLCPACRVKIKYLAPHCPLCGRKSKLGFICSNCQPKASNLYFEAVFALGKYEQNNLKIALQALKQRGLRPLGLIIGRLLGRRLVKEWHQYTLQNNPSEEVIIMPIPLHKKCLRTRGFNQAQLLAQGIAEICPWPLNYNLKRLSYQKPSAPLSYSTERRQKKIFFYQGSDNLAATIIILVDDVFTTGATANAAAQALKQAGAKKIIVAVAAKSL
ncbi:MAG: phosphoribosyltransferase family protein [Patescibacteria group bacterium]|nr:phosphoribosyltransferase family protein [Patescibacteria group bacterium]